MRLTEVPFATVAEHVPPEEVQDMPPVLDVTVPLPETVTETM